MQYKISDIESVECIDDCEEYVYDIEMSDDTEHTFFANDILVHNSVYFTIKPALKQLGKKLLNEHGKVSHTAHEIANKIEEHLNKEIIEWSKSNLNAYDCRFVFKRESICDVGIFIEKKRYILHILDDEGVEEDKIKYVGVEVASTSTPKKAKVLIKHIVETMIKTKDYKKTNEVYFDSYEKFKTMNIEELAFPRGIKGYEKYYGKSDGFTTGKGTPIHVKSAIFYNQLLNRLNLTSKYEQIRSGIKIKFFYAATNKYNIDTIAFLDKYPVEFEIKADIDKMFDKIVTKAVQRLYNVVGWKVKSPNSEIACDLFELLS